MNVLIVDDHQVNRRLLRAQLEAEEHDVSEAVNGAEALAMLDSTVPDLIISDILMPVMDGYRLCAEIRASASHRDIPFIFYTATYTSPADEQLCYDLGGDAYLRKPLSAADLVLAIGRVLGAPRRAPALTASQHDILKEYSERLVFKLEQKNVELADASDRLRLQAAALDSAADAIVVTDVNGTISWVNRAFADATGVSSANAIGRTLSSLRISLEHAVFTRSFWEAYRDKVWRGESIAHREDGVRRYDELMVTPVRAANGEVTHVVGVLHDVTERREAEERLRESDRRFRSVLANLNLIAMMLDREGRITYCNDHFLHLTGWKREEILGRDWLTVVPADAEREVREVFSNLLDDDPAAWHYENEILTRTGKRLLIQWNNTVLRSSAGDVVGTASIGQDITGQRVLQQQILRAQRLESLGTLAGGIAHDLNNLFMPILLGATMLKKLRPDERSLRAIENIERSVRRGSDLVKQMLLFARGVETTPQSVHIAHVVREVESIAKSTFPKSISIDVSIGDDVGTVLGDATQLSQVLLNLAVNARDAMAEGGQLTISATTAEITERFARMHGGESAGTYVIIEVTDTGEGMSKETIDRIFDPFYTTKAVGKGTGLGLSTARGIVSSHGGFVSVASAPGEGSTFGVYLPAAAGEVAAAGEPGEEIEPARGNGELVMIVDDDPTVVNMTSQTLETFGYRIMAAEGGAEAIGLYSRHQQQIAVVITDIAMPVVDGHALIAALRRIEPGVRIIAATANASTARTTNLAKMGVAHVLSKPYTADQLLRAVAVVLAGHV